MAYCVLKYREREYDVCVWSLRLSVCECLSLYLSFFLFLSFSKSLFQGVFFSFALSISLRVCTVGRNRVRWATSFFFKTITKFNHVIGFLGRENHSSQSVKKWRTWQMWWKRYGEKSDFLHSSLVPFYTELRLFRESMNRTILHILYSTSVSALISYEQDNECEARLLWEQFIFQTFY